MTTKTKLITFLLTIAVGISVHPALFYLANFGLTYHSNLPMGFSLQKNDNDCYAYVDRDGHRDPFPNCWIPTSTLNKVVAVQDAWQWDKHIQNKKLSRNWVQQ